MTGGPVGRVPGRPVAWLSWGVSTLYLVSTPIGNLDDLSPRAAETLRSVHRILAEDTRRTRVLSDRAGADVPLVSVHEHNERERIHAILGWLAADEDLALVTDAGTPLVSDPGGRVVAAVVEAGHRVVPIPGPSAPLAALVASGLPSDRFVFLGFVARKGVQRTADLARVASSAETAIVFESAQRLLALLDDLAQVCGSDRRVAVARELTKIHEEFTRGTLADVRAHYVDHPPKGEVTVVVSPAGPEDAREALDVQAAALARELLTAGHRPSAVAREVSDRVGLARNEAYRIVHDLEPESTDS